MNKSGQPRGSCWTMCEQVCVIEADSLQLRVITVGLYLFLSRSLLCQILAVFAVVVYGPFWFRDSWALLLPGLRSPDLGCPLLPCATRLSPTESSASAYGKLRFCLRKLRLCPTEAPPLSYGKLRLVLAVYYFCNKLFFRNWILPSSLWQSLYIVRCTNSLKRGNKCLPYLLLTSKPVCLIKLYGIFLQIHL